MSVTMLPIRMSNGQVTAVPSRARWATARIEMDGGTVFVGRIFVPETKKRASDVVNDDRPFLFATEVSIEGTEHIEPFLAINKRFIKTIRILHDGDPETVAARPR